jgi:hypothetical protein
MAMFLIYALVQRTQAIKSEERANYAQVEAVEQAALAKAQAADAQKALEDCQKNK